MSRSISPHGGGDGGKGARRARINQGVVSVHVGPALRLLLMAIATTNKVSVSALASAVLRDWLQKQMTPKDV
jgi:hypothetical protein